MNILFFCDCSGSLGDAARIFRNYEYIKNLHKDIIFCNLYNYRRFRLKPLTNLQVVRSALRNANKRDVAYIKNEIYISLGKDVLTKVVQRKRPDIIFAEQETLAYIAAINQDSIPVIADLHGIWSAEHYEHPTVKRSGSYLNRIKEMENELYERVSDILVVSNNMKRYLLESSKVKENKVTVVQNGADLHYKRATYKQKMKCIYGGIFTFWEDLDAYLDMAKVDLTNDYYLIGTGPLRSHILNRIEKENIRINYLGCKTKIESLDLFCEMSIGIAPSKNNITRYVASPVKIYDYMACGLPVITPNYGEWAKHVEDTDCGIVTKNSNADDFLKAANKMRDRKVWEAKSNNGRKAIKTKFNWNRVLSPIKDVLSKY